MRDSDREPVESLCIGPGMDVMDLGGGDGTTVLPSPELSANVLSVYIGENLVAADNARVAGAGLTNIRFQQCDASNLEGLGNTRFDLVVSIFGTMFAPLHDHVAREMVRVSKSGGHIVMHNWIPG